MMFEHLTLVKPSEENIDEIHSYRQECIDCGEMIAGVYGKFNGDIDEWISFCRLAENLKHSNERGVVEMNIFYKSIAIPISIGYNRNVLNISRQESVE